MTEGEKERIKHRANYANGVAIAMLAVVGFGLALSLAAEQRVAAWGVALLFIIGFVFSVAMHTLGNWHLKRLDEND